MKNSAYLSIIVPCYNGENTIEDTILSVVSQKHHDVELIIVNDGSRDGTETICKKYDDNRTVKYFCSENSGAGHARNIGISMATGTWIAFLDADDLFIEGSLDSVIPKLYEYDKSGTDVVYTSTMKGDMQGQNAHLRTAEEINEIRHIPQFEFWSCLYRKQFLESNNIRFFEYKEQDIETAFRYRVFSNSPRAVTDHNLLFYFQRTNPSSNTHTWKVDVLHRVKSRVYLELLEQNMQKTEDAWLLETALKEVCKFYLYCTKNGCNDPGSIAHVNTTHARLLKQGRTIKKNKNTLIYLLASLLLKLSGNTIGRRKKQ